MLYRYQILVFILLSSSVKALRKSVSIWWSNELTTTTYRLTFSILVGPHCVHDDEKSSC